MWILLITINIQYPDCRILVLKLFSFYKILKSVLIPSTLCHYDFGLNFISFPCAGYYELHPSVYNNILTRHRRLLLHSRIVDTIIYTFLL